MDFFVEKKCILGGKKCVEIQLKFERATAQIYESLTEVFVTLSPVLIPLVEGMVRWVSVISEIPVPLNQSVIGTNISKDNIRIEFYYDYDDNEKEAGEYDIPKFLVVKKLTVKKDLRKLRLKAKLVR